MVFSHNIWITREQMAFTILSYRIFISMPNTDCNAICFEHIIVYRILFSRALNVYLGSLSFSPRNVAGGKLQHQKLWELWSYVAITVLPNPSYNAFHSLRRLPGHSQNQCWMRVEGVLPVFRHSLYNVEGALPVLGHSPCHIEGVLPVLRDILYVMLKVRCPCWDILYIMLKVCCPC